MFEEWEKESSEQGKEKGLQEQKGQNQEDKVKAEEGLFFPRADRRR